MKAEYIQRGESIDYVNPGDSTIAAGDIVVLGSRVGVAGCDIPPGDVGSLHTEGVYSIPKAAPGAAFEVGDQTFYDESGAAADGAVKLGWVIEPSPAGAQSVRVKL